VLDAGRLTLRSALAVVGATTLFLLVWQFATFLMFTLVGCLAVVFAMQLVERALLLQLLALFGTALAAFALLMFGSSPMYTYRSLFFVVSLALAVSAAVFGGADDRSSLVARIGVLLRRVIAFAVVCAVVFTALKRLTASDDDGHIFDVLLVRLGLKPHGDRFHIRIYTTQAEFDGPAWTLIEQLATNGVIPAAVCGALAAVWRFRELRASEMLALGMAVVSTTMFLLMMRFQVLATPLVVSASAILCGPILESCADSALALIGGGGKSTVHEAAWRRAARGGLVVALLAVLASTANRSLRSMWDLDFAHNTFADPGDSVTQLCRWVQRNADHGVFAADMVTGPQIRLCSNASIVCHPQYEDSGLRARVREVYELYGARDLPYLYNIARKVRADHVVLHKNHCAHKVGDGSRFLSVVDRDWEAQGNVLGPDSLCETAFDYHTGKLPYFDLVHQTKHHWVLRVRAPGETPSGVGYIERLKRGRDPTDGAMRCARWRRTPRMCDTTTRWRSSCTRRRSTRRCQTRCASRCRRDNLNEMRRSAHTSCIASRWRWSRGIRRRCQTMQSFWTRRATRSSAWKRAHCIDGRFRTDDRIRHITATLRSIWRLTATRCARQSSTSWRWRRRCATRTHCARMQSFCIIESRHTKHRR
jgi:hypothetical protein